MSNINLKDFQITIQRKNKSNGLKFIHFKKLNSPISIRICSRSGSRFDPKEKSGLSHFAEHLVLDGTKKYPNKKELSLVFDEIGGQYIGGTGPECKHFDFVVAKKEHLSIVADVANEVINNPLLRDKDIELERGIIKTEISSKFDYSKRVLFYKTLELMYGDNPIAFNTSGTEEVVDTLSKEDIIFHLENIFPQDMTVVSCGDCDIDYIYDLFEPILPHKKQDIFLEVPQIKKGIRYGSHKLTNQKLLYCMFTFPTSSIMSEDNTALSVLSAYLGRGRTSLLKELLRYDGGLLYSVISRNEKFSDVGFLSIEMSIKKDNLVTVFNKTKDILKSLYKDGIPKEALNTIKNKIINSGIISTQTVQSWVDLEFYRELLIRGNSYHHIDFLNEVNAITKEDIDKVIKKYLSLDNMFFYVVGDIEEKEVSNLFN